MKSFFNRAVAIISAVLIVATMLSGCGKEKSTIANEITEVHVWSGERHSKSAFVKLVEEYNNTMLDTTSVQPVVRVATQEDFLDYFHYGDDCSKVLVQTKNGDTYTIMVVR